METKLLHGIIMILFNRMIRDFNKLTSLDKNVDHKVESIPEGGSVATKMIGRVNFLSSIVMMGVEKQSFILIMKNK